MFCLVLCSCAVWPLKMQLLLSFRTQMLKKCLIEFVFILVPAALFCIHILVVIIVVVKVIYYILLCPSRINAHTDTPLIHTIFFHVWPAVSVHTLYIVIS